MERFLVEYAFTDLASIPFLKKETHTLGIDEGRWKECLHPKEDYYKISSRYPIYAIADGVTLEKNNQGIYPDPSGAAEVAGLFCATVVYSLKKYYDKEQPPDMKKVFYDANHVIAEYNKNHDRSFATSNFWDNDLYATCAVYACIYNNVVYWASIGDCLISHLRKGVCVFTSPNQMRPIVNSLPDEWASYSKQEVKKLIRSTYRNSLDEQGVITGYGSATGENNAEHYLQSDTFSLTTGDKVILYSDGFEAYFTHHEWISLLASDHCTQGSISTMTKHYEAIDPDTYGREKTIISIKVT